MKDHPEESELPKDLALTRPVLEYLNGTAPISSQRMFISYSLLIVCLMLNALRPLAAQEPGLSQPPIVGVWRVVDYTAAGRTSHPQPGFWIFTTKYYAMVMDTKDDVKRPDIADPDQATAQQLLATWGPFAAQFGTYETKGDVLTLNILAAKNPDLVGTRRLQRFNVNAKTLTTEALFVDGKPMSKPVTLKLERAE
jgi:hypothetical protein